MTAFAKQAQSDFEVAVVLGMGGSSLCPDVLARTFGPIRGYPELRVLDSTDPAQIRAMESGVDLSKTLFIVSSKSGTKGIEPTIWKIEGLDSTTDCQHVADTALREGRSHVRCIVLGRNAPQDQVERWLRAAAAVSVFIGFAVGRSTFAEALRAWRAGNATRQAAVREVARWYGRWIRAGARLPVQGLEDWHLHVGISASRAIVLYARSRAKGRISDRAGFLRA